VSHRDVVAARFLHVAQNPGRRAVGLLWAMLAATLLVATPIILMAVPHSLIYSESTRKLVGQATVALLLLHIALFIVLVRAAVRCRSSMVRLSQHGIAVANLELFNLALPSGRDNFRIQETPARWGRIHLQAVYAPQRRRQTDGTRRHPSPQSDRETLSARRRPLAGRDLARRGLARQ